MAPLNDDERVLLEGAYWWGPATLFRCELEMDPAACDVGLVGVPHSSGNGSTERDQHLGPRAVRHVSASQRRMHGEFGFSPWTACRVRDLGDVPLPEANNNEQCIKRVATFFDALGAAGTRSVSIGGDHSVTGGILRGLAGETSVLTGGEPVALVHLDAHIDAYESLSHWYGARDSAAHWASYLVREGRVDPKASVQIGMRGNPRTMSWFDPSYELGYEVVPISRYRQLGPQACIELIRARVGDRPTYITFDLDCLGRDGRAGRGEPRTGLHGVDGGRGVRSASRAARAERDRWRRRVSGPDQGRSQRDHRDGRRRGDVRDPFARCGIGRRRRWSTGPSHPRHAANQARPRTHRIYHALTPVEGGARE